MSVQQTMAILAIEIQCRQIKLQNNKKNVCVCVCMCVCVSVFPNYFNKFNTTGARMQDSINHMTLKSHFISKFCTKMSQFRH